MRRYLKRNLAIAFFVSFFLAVQALHAALLGDVTNDGHVDLVDAIGTLQVLVKNPGGSSVNASGDVNGDGRIGIEEAIYALQTEARLRNYPALNPIGSKSVDESGSLTFTIFASDPEGHALIYSALNLPVGADFDPQSRIFSWTPTYSQSGVYQVTFMVTDSDSFSTSETVTITVKDKIPAFDAPTYFPLQVGNWWDYIEEGTEEVSRTSVFGTKTIGSHMTYEVQYPEGDKEYYTSDSNGLTLYGGYIIDPDYTGDIFFNPPLLLAPNNATIGSPEHVWTSTYSLLGMTIDITAKTRLLALEDVNTQNRVLKDCIKASMQITEVIRETGETLESETTYWFYKGVGVVKQIDSWSSVTIKASYVNGVSDTY